MYFRKRTTLQTLQIRITMKRNILLLIILTVISLEASGQKYTQQGDQPDSSRIYRWYPQHQPHQCSGRRFGWK